ncbi:MAG: aldo/keto reductase [Treponema sp.]|jgi:aryl-alcohol dehydrogenase-like predicted oxidoreductase|nr:aldo/keto reductase [Treponema sp.]
MNYVQLTKTDLCVAPVCIGTAQFGVAVSDEAALKQLDLYFELGGNFIDTAHIYNDWIPGPKSRSERVIGEWLNIRNTRDKIVLSTKGAHPSFENFEQARLSAADINHDINESLAVLQTDYIDLYFLHRDDTERPVAEIIDTLDDAVQAGKIRWYGCSNWTLARVKQARDYATKKGTPGFVCSQLMWSLADIRFEHLSDKTLVGMDKEIHAYHAETKLSAMAYMGIAKGYFIRRSRGGIIPPEISATYQCPENNRIFAELTKLAKQMRLSITDLCYFYFSAQPFPAIPIAAFSSETQLREGMRHCELLAPDIAQLEALSALKSFRAAS